MPCSARMGLTCSRISACGLGEAPTFSTVVSAEAASEEAAEEAAEEAVPEPQAARLAARASAANLPLTVAAAPFVARMVEQSLEEVDGGVIEAARCMGATNWQIITRVLLVESVPSLLRGLTISTITVFGYTAITGAVGAGGLGNIAFRFGYQRYQQSVMYASLALVILVVCLIQTVFGHLASKADKRNR